MATISQRKRKKGVVYRVEVCVDGRRESATFDAKSEAHRWAEETERLLRAGQPLPGEEHDDGMDFTEAARRCAGVPKTHKSRDMPVCPSRLLASFAEGLRLPFINAFRCIAVTPTALANSF